MRFHALILLLMLGALTALPAQVPQWPQFRGPGGTGRSEDGNAPVELAAAKRKWSVELAPGHSSPSVWGDRIFVTAGEKDTRQLQLLCIDRSTGKILWRRAVTAASIENLHELGSPATATPLLDGERVYVYFGSFGLIAFDFDGQEQWRLPLPVASTRFGSGTSPILAGEAVILNRDDSAEGYLLAVDRRSGKTLWKQPYSVANGPGAAGTSTPVLWKDEIIVHRGAELVAFDRRDGTRKWWVNIRSTSTSTPAPGQDGVYVATWFPLGEPDLRVPIPDFASLLKQGDKNADGALTPEEFPDSIQLAQRIEVAVKGANIALSGKAIAGSVDRNKDGKVEQAEWDGFVAGFLTADHGLLAIKPGGQGDVTSTHVQWREGRGVPEVPTPLVSRSRVYMVTNGGIVSCMDAATGALRFRTRLGAGGAYYASPVMAGGHIYFPSGDGVVSVIRDADEFELVARSDLGEPVLATPAIAQGTVYVRTATHLYAFGK
jgi:outer membrane protein assembly factor BamB